MLLLSSNGLLIEILGAWNRGVSSNLKKAFSPQASFLFPPPHPSRPLSFTPSAVPGRGRLLKQNTKRDLGLGRWPREPDSGWAAGGGLAAAPERPQVWLPGAVLLPPGGVRGEPTPPGAGRRFASLLGCAPGPPPVAPVRSA